MGTNFPGVLYHTHLWVLQALQAEKTLVLDPRGKHQTPTEQQTFFCFDSQIQFLFGNLIFLKAKFCRKPERDGVRE